MREILDIEELRMIEQGILRHLRAICDMEGLTFCLSNGTLLGAVKYSGFIPWDDDIDLFMPRKDYEQLMRSELIDDDRYKLCSRERVSKWRLPFAKLCDMRTLLQEGSADFGISCGIGIDIFPLDVWSGGKAQAIRCGLWRRGLSASVKTTFATPKKGVARAILRGIWAVSRLLGSDFFLRRIDREVQKGQGVCEPAFVGSVAWSLYGVKEIIPAEAFHEYLRLEFEGESYPVPAGYDSYLRQLYGNYENDPPLEEQKTHHNFRVYWRETAAAD